MGDVQTPEVVEESVAEFAWDLGEIDESAEEYAVLISCYMY